MPRSQISDRAAAVLPSRNDALEPAIFERVVLDMDRQALLAGIEARPFRHRPALQHPVELEPEIIMQPARGMLLDDKGQRPGRARGAAAPAGSGVLRNRVSVGIR